MNNKLKVLVEPFAPLVIKKQDNFTGFEIDLWEAISQDLNLEFEYEQKSFQEIIETLADKKADVGISGITINEEREKNIDFSHPTLDSGLLILVNRDKDKFNLFKTLKQVFSTGNYQSIFFTILFVLFFILVFGNLIWLAEWPSQTFDHNYLHGIFQAFWMVICSMSTDCYDDYVPQTILGRVVTIGIIVGGIAIFGLLIAEVTALFTSKKISRDINNYHDLIGKDVGAVEKSTSIRFLKKLGAKITPTKRINEACQKLENDELEAVVGDAPILTYYAEEESGGKFVTVGDLFEQQEYGFALVPESPLRENINRSLLKLKESGEYNSIYRKWFGMDESMIA